MGLDDFPHKRQARAGSVVLAAAVQAAEHREDRLVVAFFDADAVVAHVDRGPRQTTDFDGGARAFVEFHGVGDQVAKHFAQPERVGRESWQHAFDAHQRASIIDGRAEGLQHVGHDFVEIGHTSGRTAVRRICE